MSQLGARVNAHLAHVREIAESMMRQTASVSRGGSTVATGVACRISHMSNSRNDIDLSAVRSGDYTVYMPATQDVRIGDYLTIDGYVYEVLGPLHSPTYRAELALDCEYLQEPGETVP